MLLMRHSILFLYILSICSFLTAQESINPSALLKHELRKSASDSILIAGDKMIPEHFLIKIPDSVYTDSKITIRKFRVHDFRTGRVLIRSSNKSIYKVRYQIKGHRKAEKFLSLILKTLAIDKEKLTKGELSWQNTKVDFTYEVSGKYHYFIFISDSPE